MRVAVLLTCHNRRPITLACLNALFASDLPKRVTLHAVLVDDGSTDGTAQAVAELFPQVKLLRGDGDLFWNRAMHLAFAYAMDIGFDAYLWLNDDTMLDTRALMLLFSALSSASPENVIVVGAVSDPARHHVTTYGGARAVTSRFRPFLATMLDPRSHPQEVDVVNGNVVLIPDGIARTLSNLDPVFEHGMGDTDYSMRARKLGIRILLTAGYVGVCARNALKGTYRDKDLPLSKRIRAVFSRKGLPWRSWLTMCMRHGGLLWPVHFLWGYLKVILRRA